MIPVILCSLASAAAFYLGLGTANLWLLAWVAPVPILWLAFGETPAKSVALSATAAYAIGQLGMLWPYYHAVGNVVLIIAAGPALVFAAIVLAARLAARRLPPVAASLLFPSLWTAWEFLAATFSPHGTFGAWAYSQVNAPILIQGASLFGLWVISFLVACVACAIALSVQRRIRAPLAVALALMIANVSYGTWRLHQPQGPIIKAAASARDHDDHASPNQIALSHVQELRGLAAQGAQVVVFPEKAALLPITQRDTVLAPLITAARETGTMVVAGFDQTGPQRRNVAFAIDGGQGGAMHTYTKRHHIPGLESNYTIGDGPALLGDGRAVVICKDLDFQSTLRSDAAAGAHGAGLHLMLAPAWDFNADGWLHARMAILRGVEGGYAIVRAAANGLVTISDSRGRLLASAPGKPSAYGSIIADVPTGTGPTFYVRIGDTFAWLAGAGGVLLVIWSLLAGRAHSPLIDIPDSGRTRPC